MTVFGSLKSLAPTSRLEPQESSIDERPLYRETLGQ